VQANAGYCLELEVCHWEGQAIATNCVMVIAIIRSLPQIHHDELVIQHLIWDETIASTDPRMPVAKDTV
jgi:hypothetical protein